MRSHFRPDTGLDTYNSLDLKNLVKGGARSLAPKFPFASYWVVLDLKKPPEPKDCCHGVQCNPSIARLLTPCNASDPRLTKYKHKFLQFIIDRRFDRFHSGDNPPLLLPPPTLELPERPSSSLSFNSDVTTSTTVPKRSRGTTQTEKA